MNTRSIAALAVIVAAIPLALWLGISIAQEQMTTVGWILGLLFGVLCLALKQHVWILIPATLGMKGDVNLIPGSPAPWHIMTAAAAGFTLLRILSRQQHLRFRWTGIETCLLLVALTILQAFVRNPTGLSILGGEVAGGKTYFVFVFAFLAFFVISSANTDLASFRRAAIAYLVVTLLDAVNAATSAFIPGYAQVMVRIYSNVSYEAAFSAEFLGDVGDERIAQFGFLGSHLALIACTLWRPLGALDITKPWRAVVALGALACTFLGGFRSQFALFFVQFIVGSGVRRRVLDMIVVSVIGLVAMAVVIAAVPTTSLPFSVQRILTLVPGVDVRGDVRMSAEKSSEGRFEVWRLALFTDKYIDNKILGDGFQMSGRELNIRRAMAIDPRVAGAMSAEEILLSSGSYHGFHAETIRFTGGIGLAAATAALIAFAVVAMRQIRYFRGRMEWPFVLFVCMPFLIEPFWYWLVFGSYKSYFPVLIAMAGMLKVLDGIRTLENCEVAGKENIR